MSAVHIFNGRISGLQLHLKLYLLLHVIDFNNYKYNGANPLNAPIPIRYLYMIDVKQ